MKIVKNLLNDHLYGNSLWIIASSVLLTGFGFFFWTINTRLFNSEQVGIASTLISAATLIVMISILGFDIAILKYLPKFKRQNIMINSCFSLAGILAIILSSIFVIFIEYLYPKLSILNNGFYGYLFVAFIVFNLFYILLSAVFVSMRKSKYVFIQGLVFSSLKLIFPFILVSWGAYGIFSSWMFSIIISFFVSIFFLRFKIRFEIQKNVIKKMIKFSTVNYFSNFFIMAPGLVIPLIITKYLSASNTAYFYIAWMITSMFLIIPTAISKTLLSEGSRNKNNLKKDVRKAFKFTFSLIIPSVIISLFLAKYVLLLFGAEYSDHAALLLQILILSSIPFSINIIYVAVKNVQHQMKPVLFVNLTIAIFSLSLSYAFISHGIIIVGYAWLATQIIVSIFTLTKLIQNG